MNDETGLTKNRFWMNWSLGHLGVITISYIVSLIAVGLVHGAFGYNLQEWGTPLSNTLMQIAGGIVLAAGTGLYQKSILKKLFRVTDSWIYALVAGFVLTELIAGIILWQMGLLRGQMRFIEFNPLPESVIFAVAGLIVGLIQWRILRKSFSKSFSWIPASTAAWWICIFMTYVMGIIDTEFSFLGFIPGAFLYGAITGYALFWIMKNNEQRI